MRIYLVLTNPDHVADEKRHPSTIGRWVSWPCVPRIGEKYRWPSLLPDYFDYDPLEEDDAAKRVADVIHEPVHRTLWQRLCGRPREVVMVFFHVRSSSLLSNINRDDPRWKYRDLRLD